MVSVLLGAAALSTALAGGYGLYRYLTARSGDAALSEDPTTTDHESVQLTAVSSAQGDSTVSKSSQSDGEDPVNGDSEDPTPTSPPKKSPVVPPKPPKQRSPAMPSQSPSGGLFPAGFTSELQERLRSRGGEAIAKTEESGGPEMNGLSAERAVSFDQVSTDGNLTYNITPPPPLPPHTHTHTQPTTPAGLSTPTRNKGPVNRRPPTKY